MPDAIDAFFTKPTRQTPRKQRNGSCSACGLHRSVRSPCMAAHGAGKRGILNIGEAPGETEDLRGRQWQGKAGKVLERKYQDLGVDLWRDCVNINAVNCRPTSKTGANRAPTDAEILNCRRQVWDALHTVQPRVVVLLGKATVQSVVGGRWGGDFGKLTRWRGWAIPDQELGAWLCPTFHPSYVCRMGPEAIEVDAMWRRDLMQAFQHAQTPLPKAQEPTVSILTADDAISLLTRLRSEQKTVAIDYETTGLKPHADGHAIICAAVAAESDQAYAFMVQDHTGVEEALRRFMMDDAVGKIAHNMKFENLWSTVFLDIDKSIRWDWDTMLAAHVEDNRGGVVGLKFQCYVRYGILGYESRVARYLKPLEKDRRNANALNQVHALLKEPNGARELMHYCGLDAGLTYRLAQDQRNNLEKEATA